MTAGTWSTNSTSPPTLGRVPVPDGASNTSHRARWRSSTSDHEAQGLIYVTRVLTYVLSYVIPASDICLMRSDRFLLHV